MIKRRILPFALFLFAVAVGGCAPRAPISRSETIASYVRSDFKQTDTEAWWSFTDLLGGLRSKENYVVEGQFLEPQGQWTLHSHFNGFNTRDGVQITARRDGETLTFSFSTPQYPDARSVVIEKPFQNNLGEFRYRIEIHNGTVDGARIFIWKDWWSLQGEVITARTPIMAGNAEFDSRKGGGFFLSSGRGVHWGLEFRGVRVTRVSREAPYAP